MVFRWLYCRRGSDAKENRQRKIYVGEVLEVDDEGSKEEPVVEDVEDESSVDGEFELAKVGPMGPKLGTQRTSVAVRRTSIGSGKPGADQLPRFGKNVNFPSNRIVSSRYTWYTFLPKNILEQLRRIVNFYFVFMCIIQLISESPVSPVTTATPLVFVLFVTALKQGYEDWLRHCADNLVNNRAVNIVKNGELVTVKAKDLVVGDVVKLEGEEQVPADILVVGSSDEFLRCHISTCNLDGETNLKIRYCPSGLPPLKTEFDFLHLHVLIECDQPSADLYEFTGSVLIPMNHMASRLRCQSSHSFIGKGISVTKNSVATPIPTEKGVSGSELDIKASPMSPPVSKGISRRRHSSCGSLTSGSVSDFFQIGISMENVALRGTKVKNTDFVYGIVIFTGKDTRLALNSKVTNTKFSTVEKSVNAFLILFIIFLLVLVCVCIVLHFVGLSTFDKAWYMPEDSFGPSHIFNTFGTFLVLFNYVIPISLYVTMELQKFFGSRFFVYDEEMRCPVTGQPALCNTSDLNEELGQIEYLFSDKTGTLTQNVMEFRFCSVDENRYDFKEDDLLYVVDDSQGINDVVVPSQSKALTKFFRTLALCHTVQLTPHRRPSFELTGSGFGLMKKITPQMKAASSLFQLQDGGGRKVPGIMANWEFQASSPDEKALLEACCRLGVVYLGEKNNVLTLEVFGETEKYKRHYVLEFDPDRKCMSVIIEDSKGQIWLLSKGAETSIMSKADSGPMKPTLKHIVDFALMGMRTLAVAERKLSQSEFQEFSQKVRRARRMVKGREERMREIYASMERNLTIVGATGVEDQLQEGVPETLSALSAAGIRVWMITGDKVETAVNVGISCGMVTPATTQLFATGCTTADETIAKFEELSTQVQPGENTTLIVDGDTLGYGLKCCPEAVRQVAMGAYRVLACRMSPSAKSEVVAMVKSSDRKPITAAVGDGANDVAMIQEAHIGLGIMGKEGRQAARCSDFAVARFSFLQKAILVHGNWFYVRIALLAMYFFYKNLIFILPQVYFSVDSDFSGQTLYNPFFLTLYNIFFTASPIFTYGLQEQSHPARVLMTKPQLYKELTRNSCLTWKNFIVWHVLAIYHSLIAYYIPRCVWVDVNPEVNDLASFGTLVFVNVFVVVHVKLLEFTKFFSGWSAFSFFYSLSTLILLTGLYSEVDWRSIWVKMNPGDFHGSFFKVMGYPEFWLTVIFVTVASLLPDFTGRAIINSWPAIKRIWKQMRKTHPYNAPNNALVVPIDVEP